MSFSMSSQIFRACLNSANIVIVCPGFHSGNNTGCSFTLPLPFLLEEDVVPSNVECCSLSFLLITDVLGAAEVLVVIVVVRMIMNNIQRSKEPRPLLTRKVK